MNPTYVVSIEFTFTRRLVSHATVGISMRIALHFSNVYGGALEFANILLLSLHGGHSKFKPLLNPSQQCFKCLFKIPFEHTSKDLWHSGWYHGWSKIPLFFTIQPKIYVNGNFVLVSFLQHLWFHSIRRKLLHILLKDDFFFFFNVLLHYCDGFYSSKFSIRIDHQIRNSENFGFSLT